jgi:hypothetical protein
VHDVLHQPNQQPDAWASNLGQQSRPQQLQEMHKEGQGQGRSAEPRKSTETGKNKKKKKKKDKKRKTEEADERRLEELHTHRPEASNDESDAAAEFANIFSGGGGGGGGDVDSFETSTPATNSSLRRSTSISMLPSSSGTPSNNHGGFLVPQVNGE